jgi:endoglucanase
MLAAIVSVVALRGCSRTARSGSPFSGVRLFADPRSPAVQAQASLEGSDPVAASLLSKITSYPSGIWLGGWIPTSRIVATIQSVMQEAAARNSMPLLVLYAFPDQGCERDVAGGAHGAIDYERWIGQVVTGIGTGKSAVILEPDALAGLAQPGCLSPAERRNRLNLLRLAIDQLVRLPNTVVYLDAGHSRWLPAGVMAPLLLAAGVDRIRGFSLNVSNFNSTGAEESYGDRLSALLHGKHYVIDTSRNGVATANTWCNPPGQALGTPPTTQTGNPLADALLWIKQPWASDGTCNGGPPAGTFWLPYTLGLAANARW